MSGGSAQNKDISVFTISHRILHFSTKQNNTKSRAKWPKDKKKYSLRTVVSIVVDIDSCSDPTNDKRNSTSYQIEP